jgi:hypothetical protein
MKLFRISVAVLFLGGGASAPLTAQVPDSSLILRSADELESLRLLLSSDKVTRTLDKATHKLAIWSIVTEVSPGLPTNKDEGSEKRTFYHHFELGSRRGLSTKMYRLTFAVLKDTDGETEIESRPAKFFPRRQPPQGGLTLRDVTNLVIFRTLLQDTNVYHQLSGFFPGHHIVSFQLERDPAPQELWEERLYHASFVLREVDTENLIYLRYSVVYNRAEEEVTEIVRKE